MQVRVNRSRCQGVAVCVAIAPTVFELDEDDKADILDPYSVDEETLLRAARGCPYDAIILLDDEGNQFYPVEPKSGLQ